MTGVELFYITWMLLVLAAIRFGLPLLFTLLIKLGCCRLLHLKPDRS